MEAEFPVPNNCFLDETAATLLQLRISTWDSMASTAALKSSWDKDPIETPVRTSEILDAEASPLLPCQTGLRI